MSATALQNMTLSELLQFANLTVDPSTPDQMTISLAVPLADVLDIVMAMDGEDGVVVDAEAAAEALTGAAASAETTPLTPATIGDVKPKRILKPSRTLKPALSATQDLPIAAGQKRPREEEVAVSPAAPPAKAKRVLKRAVTRNEVEERTLKHAVSIKSEVDETEAAPAQAAKPFTRVLKRAVTKEEAQAQEEAQIATQAPVVPAPAFPKRVLKRAVTKEEQQAQEEAQSAKPARVLKRAQTKEQQAQNAVHAA